MNRTASIILAIFGFFAAETMYSLGSESSHLSKLMDFYYYPIALGIFGLIAHLRKNHSLFGNKATDFSYFLNQILH